MRGRRVALLLTGLWPLLAKDDVPATETNVTIHADENDTSLALEQPHTLPLNVLTTSNPSNIVMVDPTFDTNVMEGLIEMDENNDNILHDQQHHLVGTEKSLEHDSQPPSSDRMTTEEPPDTPDASGQVKEETKTRDEASITPSKPHSDAESESDCEQPVETAQDTEPAKEAETSIDASEQEEPGDSTSTETKQAERIKQEMAEDEDLSTDRVLVDYASKSAGALILEKSPSMKGTSNLLNDDNDKYAIAPCADKKFVVIYLSEDILVKQVKLANYERYSSHLHEFQILGSQTLGEWEDLGTYYAEPGNGEQTFDLKEPAWARYLKFRFISHHGSEHYCTYSQIKVHGSTMLQGFHEQWDSQENLNEGDDLQEGAVEVESTENNENENDSPSNIVEAFLEDENSSSEVEHTGNENSGGPSEVDRAPPGTTAETARKIAETTHEDSSGDESSMAVDDSAETDTESNDAEQQTGPSVVSPSGRPDETETTGTGEAYAISLADEDTTEGSKPTLSSASIDISSQNAAMSERSRTTEELHTIAIKPAEKGLRAVVTSVVKEMVTAEALVTVDDARSVSDVLKDIQESLKTIGRTHNVVNIGSKIERPKVEDSTDVKAATNPEKEEVPSSDAPVKVESMKANESGVLDTDEQLDKKVEGDDVMHRSSEAVSADADADARQEEDGEVNTSAVESRTHLTTEKVSHADLDPVLASIVTRFPSTACMDGLDYNGFKAKIVAARKASAQGGQPAGHTGKMEPIFKLLTDEIRSLQTSQTVQDQYMKSLITCYQQVILEMAETLVHVESRQEERLSDLEEAVNRMRSGLLSRVLAVIFGCASTCMVGARLLCRAIAASLETLVALGLIDDKTGAFLLFAAFSVVFLAIGYSVCAVRSREPKKPSTGSRDADVTKKLGTNEAPSKKNFQKAVVGDEASTKAIPSSVTTDAAQSDNNSDTSDRTTIPVVVPAPRKEKAHTAYEPDLIPAVE